jgi:hypothetical protein
VISWPGGLKMQLYWHDTPPAYDALTTVPENRVYVSAARADNLVNAFIRFSRGKVTANEWRADGAEIGQPGTTYRRIRIKSKFGDMQVMTTDGHLPYPFGYEVSGYEVASLTQTLANARAAGAQVLFGPYDAGERNTAMVLFPGGIVAEIHSPALAAARSTSSGK